MWHRLPFPTNISPHSPAQPVLPSQQAQDPLTLDTWKGHLPQWLAFPQEQLTAEHGDQTTWPASLQLKAWALLSMQFLLLSLPLGGKKISDSKDSGTNEEDANY